MADDPGKSNWRDQVSLRQFRCVSCRKRFSQWADKPANCPSCGCLADPGPTLEEQIAAFEPGSDPRVLGALRAAAEAFDEGARDGGR